jgi:DNA-binding transcriptional LysR family regulator
MRIDILKQYIEVARTLSFSRTAAKLNLSLSTLSRNMAALERSVGETLLLRSQPIQLTAAGGVVLGYANEIVAAEENMRAALKRSRSQAKNTLKILDVTPVPIAAGLIRELAAQLCQNDPSLKLLMQPLTGKNLIEALCDGSLDVGYYHFVEAESDATALLDKAGLDFFEITPYDNTLRIAIPRSNHLAQKERLTLNDLREIEFLRSADAGMEHLFISTEKALLQAGVRFRTHLISVQGMSDLMTNVHRNCAAFVATSVLNAQLIPDSALKQYRLTDCEGLDLRLHLLLIWKRDSPNPAVPLFRRCLKDLMDKEQA